MTYVGILLSTYKFIKNSTPTLHSALCITAVVPVSHFLSMALCGVIDTIYITFDDLIPQPVLTLDHNQDDLILQFYTKWRSRLNFLEGRQTVTVLMCRNLIHLHIACDI